MSTFACVIVIFFFVVVSIVLRLNNTSDDGHHLNLSTSHIHTVFLCLLKKYIMRFHGDQFSVCVES